MLIKDNALESGMPFDEHDDVPLAETSDTSSDVDEESSYVIEEDYTVDPPATEEDTDVDAPEQEAPETDVPDGKRSIGRMIREELPLDTLNGFITGEFLSKEFILKQLPYVLLLAFMAVCYITNRYHAEQTELEVVHLQKELEHQRTLSLVQFTKLTGMSRQSELEKRLRQMGDSTLIVPRKPPFVIRISDQ